MRVSDAFPSNWLKAADLRGKEVTVTMSHVAAEEIGGDHKPVLYFQGTSKGLVLNKTNASNIATQYGDEMEAWSGHKITLFPSQADFQGKSVPCIRVRLGGVVQQSQAPLDRENPENNLGPVDSDPFSDSIPF